MQKYPKLRTAPNGTITDYYIDKAKRKCKCAICGKQIQKGQKIQRIETLVYWDNFHGRFQNFVICVDHDPYEIFGNN